MSIKIVRNEAGNCITFRGSSNPVHFNACLSGEVDSSDNTRVNIINDIRTAETGVKEYEFFNIEYTEFLDKDGNTFNSAQEVADYITVNGNVAAPEDINVGYKGTYDASSGVIPAGTYVNGDWFYIEVEGTIESVLYEVNDIIKYDEGADTWGQIKSAFATVTQLEASALDFYDHYVDGSYSGTIRTGTAIHPYNNLTTAIAASNEGDSILIEGTIEAPLSSDAAFNIPHSLNFYGADGAIVKYAAYDSANGSLFYFQGADNTKSLKFKNLTLMNAGEYAIHTNKTTKVTIEDCTILNCGWNGTSISTIAAGSGGTLGYDSSSAALQAFYAGTNVSNGGAIRVEESTQVLIIGNTVTKNFRGIRVQDCGVGGAGVITRNQVTQNIESGIYVAAGSTHYGSQNITVSMNVSGYNSNNGLLVVGGMNNKFSQNEVNGNWNAGFCAWGASNSTLRDCGLYDNNRSDYNGIGETADAKASIQINEAYDLLGTSVTLSPSASFIAELLDTQVHNTGLGSASEKIGFLITSDVGALSDSPKNIIKVDDVGFIGQDHAIDLSEVDIDNLRLSLGDNSYQSIGLSAVKAPLAGKYSELPFSNHVMNVPAVDVVVDTLNQTIALHEGVGGNVINVYNINELQSVLKTNSVDIIQKSSDKIQLRDCTLGNVYINGVVAGSNINTMNDSLNATFNMDLTEYKEFIETEVGVIGDGASATFYYIESPDGTYHYPLFKTEAEANQVDIDLGGSGTSHNHTYVDDLTNTTWYMPDVSNHMSSSVLPVNGLYTAPNGGEIESVVWNIQTTDDDANYLPTFNNITYNVQEGSAINIQYKAAGMTDTFNLTNVPAGYADNGFAIIGTAEDITNGAGNSVQHVINVTKANDFGSVQGTITINVLANLSGNEFTLVDQSGAIKFTQDGGVTVLDFNTVTFNAGSTYKFFLDGSTVQTNDVVDLVNADGSTITGNDGLTQSGGSGPGYAGSYFQYVIPTDVAPGKFITFTDGATSTAYANVPLTIAGSTYTTSVTGVTAEGPTANFTGTTIVSLSSGGVGDGWLSNDDTLAAGQRIVFDSAFITDLHASMPDYSMVFIGLKDDNWTNTTDHLSGLKGGAGVRFMRIQGDVGQTGLFMIAYANGTNTSQFYATDLTNVQAFIEVTSDGNNIRLGVIDSSSYNATTDTYANWDSGQRVETGDQGYGITTIDPVIYWSAANTGGGINTVGWDYSEVDWTGLTEVSVPVTSTNATSWTKAVDFSGGNEHVKQVSSSTTGNAIRMGGLSVTTAAATTGGYTSNDGQARPWATAIVVSSDGNNSNQHIWNLGEGTATGDDNIYLRTDQFGALYFGWGREGSGYNEQLILANMGTGTYGIYIAHDGRRMSASDATSTNLNGSFRFKVMFYSGGSWIFNPNPTFGGQGSWSSTGARMDRTIAGDFTIGGRGSNRNFHGKVASMVVTSLDRNVAMPTNAEIEMMITDPVGWLNDYKVGNTYRQPHSYFTYNFALNNNGSAYATQVWLMGDGSNDSYANGIRNYVANYDQNITKLQFNNMLSSDIVNVNIAGLS